MITNDSTNSARSRKLKESVLPIETTKNLSFGKLTTDMLKYGSSFIGGYKIDNQQIGAVSMGSPEPDIRGYYSFDIDRSAFINDKNTNTPLSNWNSLLPNMNNVVVYTFVDILLIGVASSNTSDPNDYYSFVMSGINISSDTLSRSDSFGSLFSTNINANNELEIFGDRWIDGESFDAVINSKVSIADPFNSHQEQSPIKKQTVENDSDSTGFQFKVVGQSPDPDGFISGTAVSLLGRVNGFNGVLHGLQLNLDFTPFNLNYSYVGGERQTGGEVDQEFNSYNCSYLVNITPPGGYQNHDPVSITKTSGILFGDGSLEIHPLPIWKNYETGISLGHNNSFSDITFSMNSDKNSISISLFPSNTYYFDFLINGLGLDTQDSYFSFGKKLRFGVTNKPNDEPDSTTQTIYALEIEDSGYLGQNPAILNIGILKNNLQEDCVTIEIVPNGEVTTEFDVVFKGTVVTTPALWDYDAHKFIIESGITDAHTIKGIHNLVVDLKSKFLWDKIFHFYPFVGGTAARHALNLKSPGINSLSFSGGWTHNSSGALGNGSNTYALTGVSSSSLGGFISMGVYLNNTKPSSPTYAAEMGEYSVSIFLLIDTSGSQKRYYNIGDTATIAKSGVDGKGFWAQTRRSATDFSGIFSDGTFGTNGTNVGSTYPSATSGISIGARNTTGTPDFPSAQRFASAFIATSLTDEELKRMKMIVEKYNRWLYRF